MRVQELGVARRYARALLDVAGAEAAAVREALAAAVETVRTHDDLRIALEHPTLPAERKRALVAAVWPQVPAPVRRLLDVLVERHRIALLPAIGSAYNALHNAQRGVVAATAIAAVDLDAQQRTALEGALAQASGRTVDLEVRKDPAVLGGVLVHMGGRTYDGTVRRHLQTLREALSGRAGEA